MLFRELVIRTGLTVVGRISSLSPSEGFLLFHRLLFGYFQSLQEFGTEKNKHTMLLRAELDSHYPGTHG
jgi:hypothetical protein